MRGDFDISIQVLSLSPAHLQTSAGIMARVDLSKGSQYVFFQVFTGNNPENNKLGGCELKYRAKKSTAMKAIKTDPSIVANKFTVDYPNTWIRLKRRGEIFKSYISHDNMNWHIYSVHKQKMPEFLLVGLAVSSQDSQTIPPPPLRDIF